VMTNEFGYTDSYEDGLEPGNTEWLQNVRQTAVQINQAWLFAERKVSGRGFGVGGRVDFVYGTDAKYLQSEGLEKKWRTGYNPFQNGDYYGAFAQAYGEIGFNKLSVKVGKMLSTLETETDSVMAPHRNFYSWSYTHHYKPHTMTGIVGDYKVSDRITAFGGWVTGFDQSFYDDKDNAAVGGVKVKLGKVDLLYSLAVGQYDHDDAEKDKYFVQTLAASAKLSSRLTYNFDWTLRNDQNGDGDRGDGIDRFARQGGYGINQELIYKLRKNLSVGTRVEWIHGYAGDAGDTAGFDATALTFGASWTPTKWLLVRPEVRYDKDDEPIYAGGTKTYQTTYGISAVAKY